jgi:hypothetical protein
MNSIRVNRLDAFANSSMEFFTRGSGPSQRRYFIGQNGTSIWSTGGSERMRISDDGTFRVAGAGTAGSTDAVQFSGSAPANSLVLNSTGNLGIGTSSPASPLQINSATAPTSGPILRIDNTATTTYSAGDYVGGQIRINFTNATSRYAGINFSNTGATSQEFFGAVQNASGYSDFVWQGYNGSYGERMRLDSSGNLGLGVTPSAWNTAGSTRAFEFQTDQGSGSLAGWFGSINLMNNAIFSATGGGTMRYVASTTATQYQQYNGSHLWLTAPSGTAGNAISFTQAMTLDSSGNLGLGVTPSPWGTSIIKAIQIGNGAGFGGNTLSGVPDAYMTSNCYFDGTNWRYITNDAAITFDLRTNTAANVAAVWNIAAGGTAGNPITFTQTMILNTTGLGIGTSSPSYKLDVNGTLNASGVITGAGRALVFSTTFNMSGLNENLYYPVTIYISEARTTRLRIENALNSNKPSWATHPSGFSVYFEWISNGSGWGTIPVHRRINDWREAWANVQIVGGLAQLTNDDLEVIWLRGGGNYFFSADNSVVATIRTSYFEINGLSVNTSVSPVNNPYDQANGRMSYGIFHATQAMQIGSNAVLHAGNYNSYALPLTGGNITGSGFIDFGPNSNWSATLRVGGNGHGGTTRASVATTNGNLHLDAAANHGTYLNWHSTGTSGVFFSNGNGGEVARIDNRGALTSSVPAGTAMHVRRTGSASVATNAFTALFEQTHGDHSWGIVGEFRVGNANGSDRPSILFSQGYNTTTWSVGFGYTDDQFRIRQNHGHRNQGWGEERFRIDTDGNAYISSGNLLVGTTSIAGVGITMQPASGNIIQKYSGTSLNTMTEFKNNNGTVGFISSSGTSTTYNTSSDYRLKENIQPMTGALAKVAALKPCTFNWKENGSAGQGFIAHELVEVVPDCVTGEKDAVNKDGSIKSQGVDTSFLVATLTAAIQEQQSIIESLTARIAALEAA